MEIIIVWFVFSFIIGLIGNNRKIGFAGSFILSLLLSPLIGLIITVISESNTTYFARLKAERLQKEMNAKLQTMETSKISIADEMEKLQRLKEQNLISEEDFAMAKNKLLQ